MFKTFYSFIIIIIIIIKLNSFIIKTRVVVLHGLAKANAVHAADSPTAA